MRDLYLKRNELRELSKNLRSCKFDMQIAKEDVTHIIKVQNDVWNRYKFYDNYIKIGGKINGRKKVHIKER